MTSMARRLMDDQRGFFRGLIVVAVVLVVIALIGIDVISVMTSAGHLREDAGKAANTARTVYVDTGSDALAEAAAGSYLSSRGASMVSFKP